MSDWLEEAQKGGAAPAQSAPRSAPAQPPGGDWLDNALDKTATAAEGFASAIPGGKLVARKGQQLLEKIEGLPGDESAIARQQADREARNPGTHLAGAATGFVTGGLALPGSGAVSMAGKAAAAAATAALLTPAYKLGEVADQAALKNTPISVEQIHQAFSFDDILSSSVLASAADLALHGAGRGVSKLAPKLESMAEGQAAKLFKKAPAKTGMSAEALGKKALDEGLFTPEAVEKQLDGVSSRFDSLKGNLDAEAGGMVAGTIAQRLVDHADAHAQFSLDGPRKYVLGIAKKLAEPPEGAAWDGDALHEQLNMISSKARTVKDPSVKAFLQDALEIGRDEFATGLETVNEGAGQEWRAALNDWKIYTNMAKDLKSAPKQLTGGDVAKTAGKLAAMAALPAIGMQAGGVAGQAIGLGVDAALGMPAYQSTKGLLGGTNRARLMQQFSKVAPGANFEAKAKQVVDFLMKPGTEMISKMPANDLHARYEEVSKALQSFAANPDGAAQNLRESLDWLPQQQADAVVAKAMNTLAEHAVETQTQTGVNTAFGYHTTKTDREKRETLRRIEAAHDPAYAISTGRADLVQLAAKHNPETVRELQKRVMAEISTREDVPFSTKRRVAATLGVAGTPTQDPIMGGRLQKIIATQRQMQSAQGQVASTRNKVAGVKKDLESATRVQNLMGLNNKE